MSEARHIPAITPAQSAGQAAHLARSCECGVQAGLESQCPACTAAETLGASPGVRLGGVDTALEREADQVADQVMSQAGANDVASARPVSVQRMPEGEDEEELQLKPVAGSEPVIRQIRTSVTEDNLQEKPARPGSTRSVQPVSRAADAVRGGGQPLSRAELSFFEPRFGRDLSFVRVHTGPQAQEAAKSINARAYTLRNNIAFARGEYAPSSHTGRKLMAHELTHTLQQHDQIAGVARIQRRFTPLSGRTPVCDPPKTLKGSARTTWLRELGNEAHGEIQKKFLRGGRNRLKELTLPFTDTSTHKDPESGFPAIPTSTGRPDLAIAKRRRGKIELRLGEIKPYNVFNMSLGTGLMLGYRSAVERNEDVCKDGADSFIPEYVPLIANYCARIGATSGQMVELGKNIGWQPGGVTAKGRPLITVNLGGVIGYACADLSKKEKKKKKDKKKQDKKKSKSAKKAAKTEAKQAKKTAAKSAKKGAKKQAAKSAAKKGVLKKLGKKAIPGAAYLEAAAIALALLGGAKPSFAGDGMSAEEALLEMAEHGLPPDVEISPELMALLKENPEVLELLKQAAEGEAVSDEAAQAMIDLLEASKDELDADTLEKLAKFTAESNAPEMQQTAEQFREMLEKIKKGAKPGGDGSESESGDGSGILEEEESDAPTDEGKDASAEASTPTEPQISDEFRSELDADATKKDLFREVVERSDEAAFGKEKIAEFRAAMEGLSPDKIAKILDELAKMPKAPKTEDADSAPTSKPALDVVKEMAQKLKAGESLPEQTQQPADANADPADTEPEAQPATAGLSEMEAKWAVAGIQYHASEGGKKYELGFTFAYSRDALRVELAAIHKRKIDAGNDQPASLGSLMAGIGYRLGNGTRVGTFGRVSVVGISGQRLSLKISSHKTFIKKDGTQIEETITIPDMEVFSVIKKSIYDFSKGADE